MRYLILTSIFFVVLISLCVIPDIPIPDMSFPETPVQQAGTVLTVDSASPDVFLSAATSSSTIRSGRTFQITFELRNKQTYNLRNVVVEAYDYSCFESGTFREGPYLLKANQSRMWSWKFTSKDIDLETRCLIRFRTSYDADYSYFQDIAVLPDYEYFQRESEGTLRDVPIKSSSPVSPLNMYLTFSDQQPFLESQDYYMYINYYNKGQGFFEDVDVSLIAPNNIQINSCGGYSGTGSTYSLDKDLEFIRGKATPTTCSFTTSDVSTMDIKSLSLTATYKYVLDNSILITVKP